VYLVRKLKKASNKVLYVRKSSKRTKRAVAPARAIPMGAPANKRPNNELPSENISDFHF
jgi:hypothetical protein